MGLHADVLLVTATKVETQSVLRTFEEATRQEVRTVSILGRVYHDLGELNGMRIFMAISEMGSGGVGATQQTIQKAIVALQPHAVIMVGIAFGINSKKQKIGDVLVSKQLILYDLQRVGDQKTFIRGDRAHASPRLINYLQSAAAVWKLPTEIRFGLMLTGEKLVDNIDYRSELQKLEPEAIGGEMEGAGLYVACHDAKIDWVLAKAICDWADGHKTQNKAKRQRLAADNATAFIVHALQHARLIRERVLSGVKPDDEEIMDNIRKSIVDSACIEVLSTINPNQQITVSQIPYSIDKELSKNIKSTQEILCFIAVVHEKMSSWFPTEPSLARYHMPETGSALYLWQSAFEQSTMTGIRATIALLLCAQHYIGHSLLNLNGLIRDIRSAK